MYQKGSITAFYSLILTLILSLISSFLLLAKMSVGRAQIAMAMDQSMYSEMARFDQELLEEYHVFFLDGGFGSHTLQMGKILDELQTDMTYGLSPSKEKSYSNAIDFIELTLEESAITGYTLATDQKGGVFREQAIRYMKDTAILQGISSATENISPEKSILNILGAASQGIFQGDESLFEGNTFEKIKELADTLPVEQLEQSALNRENTDEMDGQRTDEASQQVKTLTIAEKQKTEDAKKLLKKVKSLKESSILHQLIQTPEQISDWAVDEDTLVSNRECQNGMGVFEAVDAKGMVLDNFLFQEYLFGNLNHYRQQIHSTGPSYGIEYLISGKGSDVENLETVAKKLLLIREIANTAYLYTNAEKRASVETVAGLLSAVILLPELQPAIEAAMILAWAYVESLVDVRGLFSGNAVPLWKSNDSWQVGIEELLVAVSDLDRCAVSSGTMEYQDYLALLLFVVSEETKTMRCLDVIEQTLREMPGKENFSMDCAIDLLEVCMSVRVEDKKTFEIKEKRSYRNM